MFGWFRKRAGNPTVAEIAAPAGSEVAPLEQLATPSVATGALPEPVAAEPVAAEPVAPLNSDAAAKSSAATATETPVVSRRSLRAAQASEAEAAIEAPAEPAAEATAELQPDLADSIPTDEPAPQQGIIAAPSMQPAMPMSAHPNFAGLELARWNEDGPQLLDPRAALTPEAQRELLNLFDDLFGPAGRYRLEWRTDRQPGDDAMFAEMLTVDLVRRVQNTIADVAELERPEPLPELTARLRHDDHDGELRQAS